MVELAAAFDAALGASDWDDPELVLTEGPLGVSTDGMSVRVTAPLDQHEAIRALWAERVVASAFS